MTEDRQCGGRLTGATAALGDASPGRDHRSDVRGDVREERNGRTRGRQRLADDRFDVTVFEHRAAAAGEPVAVEGEGEAAKRLGDHRGVGFRDERAAGELAQGPLRLAAGDRRGRGDQHPLAGRCPARVGRDGALRVRRPDRGRRESILLAPDELQDQTRRIGGDTSAAGGPVASGKPSPLATQSPPVAARATWIASPAASELR